MDTAIAVLEGVKEDESVSRRRGVRHHGGAALLHPLVGGDQASHQVIQVFGLWTHVVYPLSLPGDRLTDIVLALPVPGVAKSWVDDPILQVARSLVARKAVTERGKRLQIEAFTEIRLRCSASSPPLPGGREAEDSLAKSRPTHPAFSHCVLAESLHGLVHARG